MRRLVLSVLLVGLVCIGVNPPEGGFLQAAPSDHVYFDQLSARPEKHVAYSLRDQLQLDKFAGSSPGASIDITYNPATDTYPFRQDAAKVLLPTGRVSIAWQVLLPINISSGTALITWDGWWGEEWLGISDTYGFSGHKTFQLMSPWIGAGLWYEIRNRYDKAASGAVSTIDVRGYAPLGPNTSIGEGDRIDPMANQFQVRPKRWTRFWVFVELAATDWERISFWVADEQQGPVQIHDRISMEAKTPSQGPEYNRISFLQLEYNSSNSWAAQHPPLTTYVRNVVVLRNVANPADFLARPGASVPMPPLPALPSPPANLRIVPSA